MEPTLVFCTCEIESNLGTRFENQKVPRSCQHGDDGRDFATIWRRTHTEFVHVDISGKGHTQDTQKVGSEQRDGMMDDKMES